MPKPTTALLKRCEAMENVKLLLNLSDIKVFFRIEGVLIETFLKKTISIVSIHLHYLRGCIR